MTKYQEGQTVLVRYPRSKQDDRAAWPWLPGTVEDVCGPDEWLIVVEVRELATLEDGSPAPDGTPGEDVWFPMCFRDSSEIRSQGGAQ